MYHLAYKRCSFLLEHWDKDKFQSCLLNAQKYQQHQPQTAEAPVIEANFPGDRLSEPRTKNYIKSSLRNTEADYFVLLNNEVKMSSADSLPQKSVIFVTIVTISLANKLLKYMPI